jgi:hypothetical protein
LAFFGGAMDWYRCNCESGEADVIKVNQIAMIIQIAINTTILRSVAFLYCTVLIKPLIIITYHHHLLHMEQVANLYKQSQASYRYDDLI